MKNRSILVATLPAILFSASILAAPVAMITDLKGSAFVGNQKVSMLKYLDAKSELRLEGQSSVVITYFANPVQHTFTGPSKIMVGDTAPSAIEGASGDTKRVGPNTTIQGGLSGDQWRRLQQAAVVMRDVKPRFDVIAPNNTSILSANDVELSWTPMDGAKSYRVVVYDDATSKIIHEATVSGGITTAELPASADLQTGKKYRWKVDALGISKPSGAFGIFTVADQPTVGKMNTIRPTDTADRPARVFYATLLEIEGYSYDAKQEWKRLAKQFPNEEALVQRSTSIK